MNPNVEDDAPSAAGSVGPPAISVAFPLATASVLVGLTTITAQIVLLREFLGVFQGNELFMALGLTAWMSLVALGTLLGRFLHRPAISSNAVFLLLSAESVVPLLTILALRYGRNLFFFPGVALGPFEIAGTSLIVLFPFCVLSGLLFALLISLAERSVSAFHPVKIYAWESFGSSVGALLFTVVMATVLNSFAILMLLCVGDLVVIGGLCRGFARWTTFLAAACGVFLWASGIQGNLDTVSRGWLFPGHRLIQADDTPYGVIVVTQQEEQVNVFENGVLLAASHDVVSVEERVHYALVQRPQHRQVLVVGGGIGDLTREILKYNPTRVDIVEIDPHLPRLGKHLGLLSADARVRVIAGDARRYVERCDSTYDAILINTPDPQSLQLNRFFTSEFFSHVKRILAPGGVISTSLLPGAEYQGKEARLLGGTLLNTLRGVFTDVLIVPGERYFFLASDHPLDIHITALIDKLGVPTDYVNHNYLVDEQLERRSLEITRLFGNETSINADEHPVCFYAQMSFWARSFGTGLGFIAVPFLLCLLVVVLRVRPVGAVVFTSGAAGSALQVILLFGLQISCGSLYFFSGILIASFMIGLTAGSIAAARMTSIGPARLLLRLQWLIVLGAFVVLGLLALVRGLSLSDLPLTWLFGTMSFCVAFLVGAQFSLGVRLTAQDGISKASLLYGLDLLGSAVGSVLAVLCILPLFGLRAACLGAALMAALGALRLMISDRGLA